MASRIVFDSSALIVLLNREAGYETVIQNKKNVVMSTVNIAEVFKYAISKKELSKEECLLLPKKLGIRVINLDQNQALLSAELYNKTKQYGLSLGDRTCIALGMIKGYPILTCDRIWETCKLDIKIITAR